MNSKIGDYDYELTTLRELTSSRTDAPFRLVDKTKTIRASRNAAAPYCKNLRNRAACLPPAEQTTEKYVDPNIRAAREELPIFRKKTELMEALDKNQVLIIIGETGSGKTSQLPQYLLELGLGIRGRIGCTQMRRIAAKAIATRVAKEQGCEVGEEVGYKVRFDNKTGPKTKIQYMTDGILLRDCVKNPALISYDAVILDEIHERTVDTDILLGVLRLIIKSRQDLKLIISSATMDVKKFSEYFSYAKVFEISGRMHPVEIIYNPSPSHQYVDAATRLVIRINESEKLGDIIVFMSGEYEIDEMCDKLLKYRSSLYRELVVLPCYTALSSEELDRIFEPTPPGKRKVVIATNIAETSLTIDGIEYVIDSGFVKQNTYDHEREQEILRPIWVSQTQAIQRAGRAGRLSAGRCYRLYDEEKFKTFTSDPEPEIKRSRLTSAVLTLKRMRFKNLCSFPFIDEPPAKAIKAAENELQRLDAIDANGKITEIGLDMASFPLDPCLSKMLVNSEQLRCADEMLTIVALLSSPPIYARSRKEAKLADAAKGRFSNNNAGDLLTMLNVFDEWIKYDRDEQWCRENFIHGRILHEVENIREQLCGTMKALNMSIESASCDSSRILKCICSGMIQNVALRTEQGHSYVTLTKRERVFIHPGSSLFYVKPKWVVYQKVVQTQKSQKSFMREVTPVTFQWLAEFNPTIFQNP